LRYVVKKIHQRFLKDFELEENKKNVAKRKH
jgi:hypothetical protein